MPARPRNLPAGIPKARSTSSEGMTREPVAAELPAMNTGLAAKALPQRVGASDPFLRIEDRGSRSSKLLEPLRLGQREQGIQHEPAEISGGAPCQAGEEFQDTTR